MVASRGIFLEPRMAQNSRRTLKVQGCCPEHNQRDVSEQLELHGKWFSHPMNISEIMKSVPVPFQNKELKSQKMFMN